MKSLLFILIFLFSLTAFAQDPALVTNTISFEWLTGLLDPLMAKYSWVGIVLMVLGTLVLAGQAIVVITPTKKDDAFMAKIKVIPVVGGLIIFIERFAIFKKK